MTPNKTLNQAYREGQQAARDGVTKYDNPYYLLDYDPETYQVDPITGKELPNVVHLGSAWGRGWRSETYRLNNPTMAARLSASDQRATIEQYVVPPNFCLAGY